MNSIFRPWIWLPSLYFIEGIPYALVNTVALLMFKRMGLSDTEAAIYTSSLSLPWLLKPLWSIFIDIFKTKRWWIMTMHVLLCVSIGSLAFMLPTSFFLQSSIAFLWFIAFSSATLDIAADGFYMISLDEHQQTLNVGVRNTFYRFATIFTEGLLLMIIGLFEVYTRNVVMAWSWGFGFLALFFLLFTIYHHFSLPHCETSKHKASHHSFKKVTKQFTHTFQAFIHKPHFGIAITFLLLYRLPEALLVKITPLFFSEKVSLGGLGLTTSEFGLVKGTVGVIGLIVGGIIGGIVVARDGFQRWKWLMVAAMSLPNIFYVLLAYFQPENLLWVNLSVGIKQLGYGFGFTFYMLYMLYFSKGESKTAHYALCTGFMALSLVLPGLVSGWISDQLGYYQSFILIILMSPISFIMAALVYIPPTFGTKKNQ